MPLLLFGDAVVARLIEKQRDALRCRLRLVLLRLLLLLTRDLARRAGFRLGQFACLAVRADARFNWPFWASCHFARASDSVFVDAYLFRDGTIRLMRMRDDRRLRDLARRHMPHELFDLFAR